MRAEWLISSPNGIPTRDRQSNFKQIGSVKQSECMGIPICLQIRHTLFTNIGDVQLDTGVHTAQASQQYKLIRRGPAGWTLRHYAPQQVTSHPARYRQ